MFCKKCGADLGQGYPEMQFCHMCGNSLKPEEPVNHMGQTNNYQYNQADSYVQGQVNKQWTPQGQHQIPNANNQIPQATITYGTQGDKKIQGLSVSKRTLPQPAVKFLIIGAVLCMISIFMNWYAPYNDSKTINIPRTQSVYNRNQYGDLKSIENRSWYDSYKTGGENSGAAGMEITFGFLTFLVILGIGLSIFFKLNYTMPAWIKWLPFGTFIYLSLFWVLGTIGAIISQGGPGLGILVFPIGLILLYLGNKRIKQSNYRA